jgi:hypothetical protein
MNNNDLFLNIGLRSLDPDAILHSIEICGIPGTTTSAGQITVNPKVKQFFEDLITRVIFRQARQMPDCDFEYLKIWLFDTKTPLEERGYEVPQLDDRDLLIKSKVVSSKLEFIYVLDNLLKGNEYKQWRKTVYKLFDPLFMKFTTPPEPPSEISNNPWFQLFSKSPFGKGLETFNKTLDPYLELKQNLFFNALIIQID